ncbi:uncharacterized protein LOC119180714 [Rhipicephalus microplus]|uniref:uncharacterized protein LOC119180714 n=1 Tax=Rhipicephalus microplus TaxID=6941 RepID=UPI003F6A63AA
MPRACDVAGCPYGARRHYCSKPTDVAFHWLPHNEPVRSKRLSAVPVCHLAKQTTNLRVCSLHFRAEDYETNRILDKACKVPFRARLRPAAPFRRCFPNPRVSPTPCPSFVHPMTYNDFSRTTMRDQYTGHTNKAVQKCKQILN